MHLNNPKQEELFRLFIKAEEEIKQFEFTPGIHYHPAAASNQLRYCARHLINALVSEDDETSNQQIDLGIRHAKRSHYDVVESALLIVLMKINEFSKDFKNTVISDVFPEWIELRTKCANIRDFIKTNDSTNNDSDLIKTCEETCSNPGSSFKEERTNKLSEYYNNISKHSLSLDIAREELNKKIKAEKLYAEESDKKHRAMIIVAIGSFIIAAIATAVAIFK